MRKFYFSVVLKMGSLHTRISSNFSIVLTNSITKNLVGKYDNLHKAFELIINPKGLSFTEAELIENYNYPTENLDAIDIDFL